MQCITSGAQPTSCPEEADSAQPTNGWQVLFSQLPADLEERARASGALLRRRSIHSASALLQLILAYAVGDYSLRQVGLWATVKGVAEVSDVTILNRLRQSVSWLEGLLAYLLSAHIVASPQAKVRLCLVDATVLSQPGSQGSDWRIHLRFNAGEMQVEGLTLTDATCGEGLHHFRFAPGEIVVADRAYGYKKELLPLLAKGVSCVVRMRWTNLAEFSQQGEAFALLGWLRSNFRTAAAEAKAVELQLTTPQGTYSVRLIACQLPAEQAEQARRRLRRKRQKQGKEATAESLYVAGFVLLLSNLPIEHWSALQVSELYRLRWQVELYFKRLKSILHLDQLRAHDPQLARAYLLAKLLAALLLDRLAHAFLAPLPTWTQESTHPLSLWRLTTLLWQSLQMLLTQNLLLLLLRTDPARLRRYLCNSPRKRPQQDVILRLFVRSLSVVNVLPALS
jgi:DDE family transposase